MKISRIRRLAASLAWVATSAAATDLQILCPEGARVRLDGADAGVCREVESGRYLRDLAPGPHEVEVTAAGGAARTFEVELDETVPGRLDAMGAAEEKGTGSLYIQCIPEECTVTLNGSELEIDQADLRLKDVPAGRYVFQFQRGKRTLEAVAFVKQGKPTGVRADFLARRAGIVSAGEIPRQDDTRWGMAQTLEAALREREMWNQLHSELRRMEALRKGQSVEKTGEAPPP